LLVSSSPLTLYGGKDMKKTPDEWLQTDEFKHITILDPDGWNRQAEDWDKEWNTPLTKEEFTNKMMMSTIMTKRV